jgi:hypothetical protein
MSTIVSAVDLWIPASVNAAPNMAEKWAEVLKAIAPIINDRRKAKIPDEAAYQNKLVELANQVWGGFFNTWGPYLSEHGRDNAAIKNSHDRNLQKGFSKWNGKLDGAFATVDGITAKKFKDQVTLSQGFWPEKVKDEVMRLTGDRIRAEGAATIAVYWLIGKPSAAGMLRPQDTGVVGGPYRVCKPMLVPSFKAALMGRLVQAGLDALASNLDPTRITLQNGVINELIQGDVDPALGLEPFATGGASHLDYVKQGALLKLSLQVSRV